MKSNYPLILSSFFCAGAFLLSLPALARPFGGGDGFGGGRRGDMPTGTTDRSGT